MKMMHATAITILLTTVASFSPRDVMGQQTAAPARPPQPGLPPTNEPSWYNSAQQKPWYSSPSVRQQLPVDEQQWERLNRRYDESWTRYNRELNAVTGTEASPDRRRRLEELNHQFYGDLSRSADDVLTDPAIRQRYRQLQYQYRNLDAFQDADVRSQLNLTHHQLQRLTDANREWHEQMSNFNRAYGNDRDDVMRRFNKARSEYNEGMRTILTPEQQQAWKDVIGEQHDFPADSYFHERTTSVEAAKPVLK